MDPDQGDKINVKMKQKEDAQFLLKNKQIYNIKNDIIMEDWIDYGKYKSKRKMQPRVKNMKDIEFNCEDQMQKGNIFERCIKDVNYKKPIDLNAKSNIRTFKVRFHPTVEQKKTLNHFFGQARFIFNKMVENKEMQDEIPKKAAFKLRDKYITVKDNDFYVKYPFLTMPKKAKDHVYDEYLTILKANKTKGIYTQSQKQKIQGQINDLQFQQQTSETEEQIDRLKKRLRKMKTFNIKFRSKKGQQCIDIQRDACNIKNRILTILPRSLGQINIHRKILKKDKYLRKYLSKDLTSVRHTIKIIKTQSQKYYLIIPYDVEVEHQTEHIPNISTTCTIDPGMRSFVTSFSTTNVKQYSDNFLEKELQRQDYLHSKMNLKRKYLRVSRQKKEQFQTAQKRYYRQIERVQNKTKQFHYDVISDLLDQYQDVIYPRYFNTSQMQLFTPKINRLIRMQNHNQFKMRMINKSHILNKKVHFIRENYTSKTCSWCYNIKHDLGPNKIFDCDTCGLHIDRDVNASKNIFMSSIKLA